MERVASAGAADSRWDLSRWGTGLWIIGCAAMSGTYLAGLALHVRSGPYDAMQLVLLIFCRETFALAAVWYVVAVALGTQARSLGLVRPRLSAVALGIVLGIAYVFLSSVVVRVLFPNDHGERLILDPLAAGKPFWRAAMLAIIGVYSPVVQEIVFRGVLLKGLLERAGPIPAITITGVVFAAVHAASGPATVFDTFAFGLVTGAIFVRTRTLTVPIAMHVTMNTFLTAWFLAAVR